MKYNIWSTQEDWNKLYEEAKKLGASDEYIKMMKKSTSYDTQYTYLQINKRRQEKQKELLPSITQ